MAKAKKLPSGSRRIQVGTGEIDERGRYRHINITAPGRRDFGTLSR